MIFTLISPAAATTPDLFRQADLRCAAAAFYAFYDVSITFINVADV